MKKYTPDYEFCLMEVDDKYGEYVLASEHEAEIAELVDLLQQAHNCIISLSKEYWANENVTPKLRAAISKHRKGG